MNKKIRQENYERGLKHGEKIYCGQDLCELIGMRIADVDSDDVDNNVVLWVEDDEKQLAVYFDDICFDGEHMSIVDKSCDELGSISLRKVTEEDLQEISNMQHYCSIEIMQDGSEEKAGIHHVYCNDIWLEKTDDFVTKGLYVFYDGRIMTEV